MIDLTEQWKKGELKVGQCYFVKLKNEKITPQMYSFVCIDGKHHCTDFGLCVGNVVEVLAPVPSYDHFVELTEKVKENQQLKELLKQWLHFYPIVLYEYEDTLKTKDIVELYEKTTNAIGEKK